MTLDLAVLVRESNRVVPNNEWVTDELFAIKRLGIETEYTKHLGNLVRNPLSSSVAYLIGITDEPPTTYPVGLNVDRGRDDAPDIDMDFMDTRRDEIKQFVDRKYGYVASIATFMEFGDKSVIRDVARVLRVPLSDVNILLKNVHDWDMFVNSREPAVIEFHLKYPHVLQFAKELHGRIRGTGVHPAGVVASKIPLSMVAPIETRNISGSDRRLTVVAVDKNEAERIGLIKMDILGLKTLTVISSTLKNIERRHGKRIDLNSIDSSDPSNLPVWEMLNKGLTKGVFQCEQGPYTNLILNMGVWNFDELVASNALVRPGAANTIGKDYIARKRGKQPVNYPHKSMKPFLESTYGCILYQEQLMQACVTIGGMTMSEANKIRRIIGKKKDPVELNAFRGKFISNAKELIGEPRAEKLWHDFEAHAGYSFNKSHAVAYSRLSWHTAWLKKFFPLEFFHAVLSNEKDRNAITDYLIEARRMGVKIKFPHVNMSDVSWTIDGDSLRFGLKNIKYISDVSAQRIIDARPFANYAELRDFVTKKGSGINSRALESMRAIGAANFKDMAISMDEAKENMYEYLGVPEIFGFTPPVDWYRKITNAADYVDGDTAIMHGYLRSIKTGDTWKINEIVDSTGSFAAFNNLDVDLEVGKAYIFLVANKEIVLAYNIDAIDGTVLKKYLDSDVSDGFVLATLSKRTKSGSRMGFIVYSIDNQLQSAILFPNKFAQIAPLIKSGNAYNMSISTSRNGGFVLNGVVHKS